jgi:hypothetical protein
VNGGEPRLRGCIGTLEARWLINGFKDYALNRYFHKTCTWHANSFFLISNVNFIKNTQRGTTLNKNMYNRFPTKYTKDTCSKNLLRLETHLDDAPLPANVT